MESDRLSRQLEFLLVADRLKTVERTCIIGDGSRRENSAEHSWHVALMAMVLAESAPDVQLGRVLELLIVHDLVEVYAGDTLIYDDAAVRGQADRESLAADRLFRLLPSDQAEWIRGLWREFEDLETPEARFAKAVDQIAPTWLHWGDHANNPGDRLTNEQVRAKKDPYIKEFPTLTAILDQVLTSAGKRGLITE